MFKTSLSLDFLSDWHVGAGLGNGAIADAILIRDVQGIPYIPGSAIKGALREGAWRLGLRDPLWKTRLPDFFFGTAQDEKISNQPGVVSVSSGRLRPDLQAWLEEQPPAVIEETVADMTILRMQTSLDSQRQIVPHSLRGMECGIPGLSFYASFTADIPETIENWFGEYLNAICACVKSMGGDRARGLGRCRIKPACAGSALPALPGALPQALLDLLKENAK